MLSLLTNASFMLSELYVRTNLRANFMTAPLKVARPTPPAKSTLESLFSTLSASPVIGCGDLSLR